MIRSWKLKNDHKYSKHLFRALTVIRGLLLSKDDSKLMHMMACHENTAVQNIEVEKIIDEFDGLSEDSEIVNKLKKISSILNTNAFELGLPHDSQPEHGISLRVRFWNRSFMMSSKNLNFKTPSPLCHKIFKKKIYSLRPPPSP